MTNNDNRKNCIPAYYYDTGEPLEHPRRELVEVNREVYEAYYRPIWRVRDKAPDPLTDVEAEVLDRIALEELVERVKKLDEEDRRICELVALGMDERKAAAAMGLSKSTFHDRKERLLARLRKEWADLI